jgi:hypothetical protein
VSLPVEVQVEPHRKQLHVTLAYHFPSQHLATLEKLQYQLTTQVRPQPNPTITSESGL